MGHVQVRKLLVITRRGTALGTVHLVLANHQVQFVIDPHGISWL